MIIGLLILFALIIEDTSISNLINPGNEYSVNDTSYSNNINIPTKTFSAYGVSFKYPSGWKTYADNSSGDNIIFVEGDVSSNNAQLQIQIMSNNGMSEQGAIKDIQEGFTPGWKKTASYSLTISNKTGYEDIFTVNDTRYDELMRFVNIYFAKNDKTYLILLQAPDKDFDKEKPNFSVIINSLKVQ